MEWARWRNELSRRHRGMDTARGSRKWDWGSQQQMGRGQMSALHCRSAAWLLWTALRGAFKTRSWKSFGTQLVFLPLLSPARSQCLASSHSEFCLALSLVSQRMNWPFLHPCLSGGVRGHSCLLPEGLSGRCWRTGGWLFLLVWLWWWQMSGLVMEAPVGCRRGWGPSGWYLCPSGKPCGMGQKVLKYCFVFHCLAAF